MCIVFVATLVAALIPMATAQDTNALPPQHLYGVGAPIELPTVIQSKGPAKLPFFCPKATCLEYEGDNDTTSANSNGLFDFENPGIGITDAEVWVGVKNGPTKLTITGISGNYYTNATGIGVNPTPAAFRSGVKAGKAGKLLGTTQGNAVATSYGTPDFGLNSLNFWIKKFSTNHKAKCCIIPPNIPYHYWIGPQFNDSSTVGYLEDNDGAARNKFASHGIKHLTDNSFFNSTSFGVVFEPTWGSSGACGGVGCDGFSTSVNGK